MNDWPPLPDPIPENPYDEDGYCDWCGNGSWKNHAPSCAWADARDGQPFETEPSDQGVPMTERPTSQCLHEGDDLGRFETDVCHGCGEHVPPGPSVQVVLTMSAEDTQTFLEDWETDHSAPVLTGGYQEHPVTVQAASLTGGLVANPQTAADPSDQQGQS